MSTGLWFATEASVTRKMLRKKIAALSTDWPKSSTMTLRDSPRKISLKGGLNLFTTLSISNRTGLLPIELNRPKNNQSKAISNLLIITQMRSCTIIKSHIYTKISFWWCCRFCIWTTISSKSSSRGFWLVNKEREKGIFTGHCSRH